MGRHWDLKCPVPAQSALSVDLIQLFPKLHLVHLRARFLSVMASVDLDDLMKINIIIGIVNNLYIGKRHQSLQGIRMKVALWDNC